MGRYTARPLSIQSLQMAGPPAARNRKVLDAQKDVATCKPAWCEHQLAGPTKIGAQKHARRNLEQPMNLAHPQQQQHSSLETSASDTLIAELRMLARRKWPRAYPH